jgi:predicted TIM-barrel fold metal-dependent hydrolase
MVIDVHTHLHPPKLFAAIRRWFMDNPGWKLDHETDPASVAETLRQNGVERFVFSSYAHRPGMARDLNAWLIEAAKSIDFYGLPMFTVHPDDPSYVENAAIALEAGCVGLKIHEDVQAFGVDDERLSVIYSMLEERSAYMLAHIGPIPWKVVTEKGFARVHSVLKKHPKLRFLVAHMGAPDTRNYLPLLAEFPGLYLDTTMAFFQFSKEYLPLSPDEVEAHAGRIVYGSDYPTTPYPYGRELNHFRAMNLSAATLDAILHGNATRLLSPLMKNATLR